jgi:hypothetical protein
MNIYYLMKKKYLLCASLFIYLYLSQNGKYIIHASFRAPVFFLILLQGKKSIFLITFLFHFLRASYIIRKIFRKIFLFFGSILRMAFLCSFTMGMLISEFCTLTR